jgi:hypothetical protein
MTVRRRLAGLVAPLLLTALPACGTGPLLPLRQDHAHLLHKVSETKSSKRTEFRELPSVPGESVPLHPTGHRSADPEQSNVLHTSIPLPDEPVKTKIDDPSPPAPAPELPPLVRAVHDLHDGKPEAAVAHLTAFDKPNQELLLQLLPPAVQVARMNLTPADPEESAAVVRQLESAVAVLTRRAGITVREAVLCSNVDGFGQYTPVRDRNALVKKTLYLLYVEVANVPCEPVSRTDGQKGYVTRLDVSMQVADEAGRAVEFVDAQSNDPVPVLRAEKAEFTRSPIHDYHVTARLQAPSRPGAYTVTVEVRDPKSGRTISRRVPFRVQ